MLDLGDGGVVVVWVAGEEDDGVGLAEAVGEGCSGLWGVGSARHLFVVQRFSSRDTLRSWGLVAGSMAWERETLRRVGLTPGPTPAMIAIGFDILLDSCDVIENNRVVGCIL